MNRVLWGLTLTLVLTLVCIPTFAQAGAESVLLGAGSSTATVKAGSALNSRQKQLAGRVQRHTVQTVPSERMPHSAVGKISTGILKSTATPAHGAVIASIQGAVISCAPGRQTASAAGSKTATEPSQTNCSGQPASETAPQKYKSVITLSFPK